MMTEPRRRITCTACGFSKIVLSRVANSRIETHKMICRKRRTTFFSGEAAPVALPAPPAERPRSRGKWDSPGGKTPRFKGRVFQRCPNCESPLREINGARTCPIGCAPM